MGYGFIEENCALEAIGLILTRLLQKSRILPDQFLSLEPIENLACFVAQLHSQGFIGEKSLNLSCQIIGVT